MRVVVFLVKFFLLAAFFIISNQGLALSQQGNLEKLGDLYVDWLAGVSGNVGNLAGYIVKVEWMPRLEDLPQDKIEVPQQKFTNIKR